MAQTAPELSLAEKRLLLALPKDGSFVSRDAIFQQMGLIASSQVETIADGPIREGLVEMSVTWPPRISLTDEGEEYKRDFLPERQLVRLLDRAGGRLPIARVEQDLGEKKARIAISWAMKRKWTRMEEENGQRTIALARGTPEGAADERLLMDMPHVITGAPPNTEAFKTLQDRKGLLDTTQLRTVELRLTASGQQLAKTLSVPELERVREVGHLSPEFLAEWAALPKETREQIKIRPFNFEVPVSVPSGGKAHPLTHIIQEIREIFVALGFQEIAGDYVEPAFWNMDALFIPQDHPAREMQDTFYVKDPARLPVDDRLFGVVKEVQTTGGKTGSTGWGGQFRKEESERALLRTHTTVTTVRHLAAHPKGPTRVFGIGRVFRNEAMDATHLPEFHQVEGIVSEDGATLAMLMGILREFYKRMGFPQVKFRPSFYPYTEPSLDVAVQWNGRWLELGGAGVFRPEVTQPLGVTSPVLAWGLGLERLAMLRLGLTDIRQLYLSDVQWLRESPLR